MKVTDIKYYCTEYNVCDSEYIKITDDCRLYYLPTPDYDIGGGFMFCGLTSDNWDGDVNYFFSGSGVFDGVRHMFMSNDEQMDRGYQNYPVLSTIIDFFTELNKLEIKYCSDMFE